MYQNAVQLNPQRMPDLIKRCEEEYDLSYEAYQQIVPQDAESRERFAVLLAQQKLWEASKIEYRKAIELSGNQRSYYDTLLEACQQQRDYPCMRTVWQELQQQEPDNLDLALKIAESFEKQHLWQQAINHYKAILQRTGQQHDVSRYCRNLSSEQGLVVGNPGVQPGA
jgi:tetratricopeptide (TPR) repeat protein